MEIRRDAAQALGESKDSCAVEPLIKALDDESEWATDTSTLTIIPEPVTMTILALGGMMMIRRNAKMKSYSKK